MTNYAMRIAICVCLSLILPLFGCRKARLSFKDWQLKWKRCKINTRGSWKTVKKKHKGNVS